MNVRLIVLAAGLGATALGTVASAQQQFPTNPAVRTDRGSDQNLRREIRRLEGVIDMLNRDRHDYNGHRVAAIADLQRAREELTQGLHYDNNH
jgi:hypothetical protein